LAIPLLCGPGTIATVLLLTNQPNTDALRVGMLAAIVAGVFLISWFILYAASALSFVSARGKVHIMTRVLGHHSRSARCAIRSPRHCALLRVINELSGVTINRWMRAQLTAREKDQ